MASVTRPSLAGTFTPEQVDGLLDAYADSGLVLNPVEVTTAGGPTAFVFDVRCARHGLPVSPDTTCALCCLVEDACRDMPTETFTLNYRAEPD